MTSKQIKIKKQVAESLDKIKAPGQSYSGIIEQLLSLWTDIKLNKKVRVELDRK
jgi:predicted CopG family antitoxin